MKHGLMDFVGLTRRF